MPDAERQRLSRRRFVAGFAGVTGGLLLPSLAVAQDQVIEPLDPTPTEPVPPTVVPSTTDSGSTTILPDDPTPTDSQATDLTTADPVDTTKALYFATTGHNLSTPFLEVWTATGGEAVLGQPLSESRFVDATGTIQQVFEVMTLEYTPALDEPWTIQATPLPSGLATSIAPASARAKVAGCSGSDASCQYFDDSGHTIGGAFATFWTQHSGAQMFGSPLSEPFTKGATTTQVFERAVLDQDAKGAISLRKVMVDQVRKSDLAVDPAFVPAPPTLGKATLVQASDGLRLRDAPNDAGKVLEVLPNNAEFIAAASDAGATWIPGFVDGHSGWVAAQYLTSPRSLATVDTANWDLTVWDGAALGETNVRQSSTTKSKETKTLEFGDPVVVVDWVAGEEVYEGANIWAKLKDGTYVYARNVGRHAPVAATPIPSDAPTSGKWIDVNLTQQLMIAYDGTKVVRVSVMTAGMPGHETPEGLFAINSRVANETMKAGTPGADGYYNLANCLFTQYFTEYGHAIHFAWWRTPETIGRPGSHGCINLLLDESQFYWDWATIGTPVLVHN